MDRRDFLKNSLAAAGGLALASCAGGSIKGEKATAENGEMTYRHIAKTGDATSILGYGCMRWPMKKNEDGIEAPDQEMVNTLVDRAIEGGITFFDSSPTYCNGLSESATGKALSRYDRSKFLVSTKLSNFDPSTHSREASMQMYHNSFKNLQVDYIDFYLLHSLGNDMDAFQARYIDNGMLDFLVEERAKGHIRNLGFSFHGNKKAFDYYLSLDEKYHWDMVLIQMNYVDWNHSGNTRNSDASYLYNELYSRGIPMMVMEPLQGGRLSRVPENIANFLMERDPSRSIASWAFRFCGTHPGVMTVLSGMTYMEHLEDNLKSFCPLEPLSEEDLAFLEQMATLMKEYPSIPCNECKYCIPCPYGIDIPGIIQHYNRCVNEGSISEDTMDPNYRKARKRYLTTYAKAIPELRQADKCIGCRQCVSKCPQSIDIPRELRKIDRYVEKLRLNEE